MDALIDLKSVIVAIQRIQDNKIEGGQEDSFLTILNTFVTEGDVRQLKKQLDVVYNRITDAK